MKKLQVFIAVLLSSSITANACGYYPYGEDIRFCFFKPEFYGYNEFSEFDYTSDSFDDKNIFEGKANPNEKNWYSYCKGKVSIDAISDAVYNLRPADFTAASKNEMVKYLFKCKDNEAIEYLKYAKTCEIANEFYSDPWERTEYVKLPQRQKLIDNALKASEKVNNKTIQLRYIFLAIRMAFYDGNFDKISQLYTTYFANSEDKDIVYYWSLYFQSYAEKNQSLVNFYAAQVFAKAPDKRFAVIGNFKDSIPVTETLKYATNNKEKANVYLLKGVRKSDRALDEIRKIYSFSKSSDGLSFLLLREVNKIEDWIYTPYYSYFEPALGFESYGDEEETSVKLILRRVEKDRQYAGQVLNFVNSVDLREVNNPMFWQMAKAQLQFAVKDFNGSLATIGVLESKINKNEKTYNELQLIKALALTASQEYGKAEIPEEVKAILLKNSGNQKFVFAIGRELEYKGNTTDAALLYSCLSDGYSEDYYANTAYWKNKKNVGYGYEDYYTDYFGYINSTYTPEQVKDLITDIEQNRSKDKFSRWKYDKLPSQLPVLYDLLGTKYIRKNKLQLALVNFNKVDKTYLDGNQAAWERVENYGDVFDKNPFYQIKYTPDFIPIKDNIKLNKYTVTKQLIKYIKRAENVKEKDRDYYYFLVANCYYNMTQYGNSWMMRRYSWSSSYATSVVEDEKEFRECNYARHYYELALKNAKTDKFKALCIRMIALCDTNRADYSARDVYPQPDYLSPYYNTLKVKYPLYYNDLTSNCTAFADYFKARR